MKKWLALAVAGVFAAAVSPAFAAENAQQERMKMCNEKAADKKGDERKKFMSECLSKQKMTQQEKMKSCNTKAAEPTRGSIKPAVTPVAAAGAPAKNGAVSQQDKMRLCSQQATGKKGQERKAFMKGCLSKKA